MREKPVDTEIAWAVTFSKQAYPLNRMSARKRPVCSLGGDEMMCAVRAMFRLERGARERARLLQCSYRRFLTSVPVT